ncbi:MAG: hypothetical protein FWC44_00230 [Methanomassiliicoccaceae archaeon]|nr:hypothetical protein [Methanomassiliicoccaceae archaeon]
MGDGLKDVKKGLLEKGTIDQNLLVWGRKREATFLHHEMVLFGVKDGKFVVLPFKDFNTIYYDEAKYFTKDEIKLEFSGLTKFITIKFKNGGTGRYQTMNGFADDAKPLVALFS